MYKEAKRIQHRMISIGHRCFTSKKLAFELLDCVESVEKKILQLRLNGYIRKIPYGFIDLYKITLRRQDRKMNIIDSIKEFEQQITACQEVIEQLKSNLDGYN